MLYTFNHEELSNTYLYIKKDSCFLVDPSHSYDQILEKIEGKELKFILLTHAHYDHIGLIHKFSVPIYIGKDEVEILFDPSYNYSPRKLPFDEKTLNLRKVIDKDIIEFENEKIQVIETPGHTKGSICYLINIFLFSGDTLFHLDVGRTDLKTGSTVDLVKSIKKLMRLNEKIKVFPGHEESSSIGEERNNNEFYLKYKGR
ncbi:MAG: MBL fold metallo-hydrolase [Acholeplasmatales bacterium]|jgi:glyoxylase-like metal-dependent hydrolase (beta-lactamase superfamily II)|nr:MBL fold metallo-hydrolase [Acholeplasmatales bacterium]